MLAGTVKLSPDITYDSDQFVEGGPDWSLSDPLPLSISAAVSAARKNLATVSKDAPAWFVYNIDLFQVGDVDSRRWYYEITLCRLSKTAEMSSGCNLSGHAMLQVAMDGTVAPLIKRHRDPSYIPDPDKVASLPYQNRWLFGPRSTTFPRQTILGGPDWNISEPLPLSIPNALNLAQKQLERYVKHPNRWKPHSIGLQLLPGTSSKWFYSFYFVKGYSSGTITGEAVLLVTFDGNVSEIEKDHPTPPY